MFEFTETILIRARPAEVWEVMSDVEAWWVTSNPEHESLELLDDGGIAVGARLQIREKIAGLPGEYTGTLTKVEPLSEVTMEAPAACYWLLGVPVSVGEGVSWRIEPAGPDSTRLSARVWARFPGGGIGRGAEWVFTHLLNGIEKDREHARVELRYLKRMIEQLSGTSAPSHA